MQCVTSKYILRNNEPKPLYKKSSLQPCRGTPRGDPALHTHNPRTTKIPDIKGLKLEEIGVLYFKWGMREMCAEKTMTDTYGCRTLAAEELRNYMVQFQIPDGDVVKNLFDHFSVNQLQRSTETANKLCTQNHAIFPRPVKKCVHDMHFRHCMWINTPIPPQESSQDEEKGDTSDSGSSTDKEQTNKPLPNSSENVPLLDDYSGPPTPGHSVLELQQPIYTPSPQRSEEGGWVSGYDSPWRYPLYPQPPPNLLSPLPNTPVARRNTPTAPQGSIFDIPPPERRLTLFDNHDMRTTNIVPGQAYMITGIAGRPETIRFQLTSDIPDVMEF
jgi:hypothetical protein